VVVAYGLILPSEIINSPRFGCINLHPSFLPKWRGAAPIQRSIMNGDKKTATTIIKMNEGLDSGDIIKQEIFELNDKISYKELANKFAYDGANLILQTIEELENSEAKFTKQAEEEVTYAKKIEKSEALLDFSNSATEIYNKIRALSGNIGAYFIYQNQRIKILEAEIIDYNQKNEDFGKISDENMEIICKIGIIKPTFLQKPGKNPVSVSEFLRNKKN
jgi:methionyl-tRNA formyltransferase